jgi:hypothetical protein
MAEDNFQLLQQQLAGKLEAVAGTPETLTAAEVALRPFQSGFTFAPDFQRFANDEVADDRGQAPDFVSGKKGTISFACSFKGSGAVGTEPAIGRYLEACGLQKQTVNSMTVGSQSGGDNSFAAGETYAATGGKTGIIAAALAGAGTLYYIITAGGALVATDVVVAGGDSATASGSSAVYSLKYSPISAGDKTITIQRGIRNSNATAAQDFLERLKGAMGNAVIDLAALDAYRIKCDLQGVVDARAAGSLFTGQTYEASEPPKLINATIQINGVTVRTDSVSFDFGNDVQMDPDPSTGGGTAGYDRARIANRQPKITINPHRMKPATLDDLGIHEAGTLVPVVVSVGTSPNRIEITAPRCQVRGWGQGERAGLEVAQLTCHVCRHATLADWDYSIVFR